MPLTKTRLKGMKKVAVFYELCYMFMDVPLKGFCQNRKKGCWPEVIRVRETFGLG